MKPEHERHVHEFKVRLNDAQLKTLEGISEPEPYIPAKGVEKRRKERLRQKRARKVTYRKNQGRR